MSHHMLQVLLKDDSQFQWPLLPKMIWETDKYQIEKERSEKLLWYQSSQSQSIYLMSPSVSLLLSTLHTNCCHVPVSIRIFRSHSQPSQLYTCHLSAQSWDSIQCIFDLTLTLFSTRSLISLNNPTILQQVYKGQEQNSFNFLWKRWKVYLTDLQ